MTAEEITYILDWDPTEELMTLEDDPEDEQLLLFKEIP